MNWNSMEQRLMLWFRIIKNQNVKVKLGDDVIVSIEHISYLGSNVYINISCSREKDLELKRLSRL